MLSSHSTASDVFDNKYKYFDWNTYILPKPLKDPEHQVHVHNTIPKLGKSGRSDKPPEAVSSQQAQNEFKVWLWGIERYNLIALLHEWRCISIFNKL